MARDLPKHARRNSWSGRAWFLGGAVIASMGIMIGALAAIPDAAGVIHGCYNPKLQNRLRVIDTAKGQKCSSVEKPLTWNQIGAPGSPGLQGIQGSPGPSGVPGEDARAATQAQIPFAASDYLDGSCTGDDWEFFWGDGCVGSVQQANEEVVSVAIDSADYPEGATARFEVALSASDGTSCVRLFDVTADTPVDGSEICVEGPDISVRVREDASIALALPGTHIYSLQGRTLGVTGFNATIIEARIIVDWA